MPCARAQQLRAFVHTRSGNERPRGERAVQIPENRQYDRRAARQAYGARLLPRRATPIALFGALLFVTLP